MPFRKTSNTSSGGTASSGGMSGGTVRPPKPPWPKRKKNLGEKEKRSLHLVEFSHGKPNEISLNVLGNLAAEQEGSKKHGLFGRRASSSHGTVQESSLGLPEVETAVQPKRGRKGSRKRAAAGVHAAAAHGGGSGSLIGSDSRAEIQRRQKTRRMARIVSIAVVVAVCVGLLGAGGAYLYKEYQRTLSDQALIKTACEYIESADSTLVEIDEFFNQAFEDGTVARAQELEGRIPAALDDLEKAKDYATRANDDLDGQTRDKEAAERTLNAIAQREQLFDVAQQRLEADATAKQAKDSLEQAQTTMESGNSLMAQAAKLVSNTTNENVNKSTEYLNQARECFVSVQEALSAVESAYEGTTLDLSVQDSYIAKRIEAIDAALASNEAILIQDKQTAESYNDQYNAADLEATTIAESMPDQLYEPLVDAYVAQSEQLQQQYDALRNDIGVNDAFLREYLGTETKEA